MQKGIRRRDLLKAGGAGLLGVGAGHAVVRRALQAEPNVL